MLRYITDADNGRGDVQRMLQCLQGLYRFPRPGQSKEERKKGRKEERKEGRKKGRKKGYGVSETAFFLDINKIRLYFEKTIVSSSVSVNAIKDQKIQL